MTTPRIAPLEPPYEAAIADELARWMPPGSPLPPLALFRTLATDHPLAQAMWGLGSFLLSRRLALPLREREIVIDRVCARCGCEYEWGVHAVAFAAAAGFSEAEVAATLRARGRRGGLERARGAAGSPGRRAARHRAGRRRALAAARSRTTTSASCSSSWCCAAGTT